MGVLMSTAPHKALGEEWRKALLKHLESDGEMNLVHHTSK